MSLAGARILVVDDEVDLAENIREILEDEGAQVDVAGTAAAAMAALSPAHEVALLDVRLPDATGLELLRRLRRAQPRPFETLLITGNASMEDAIAAVEAGAYAYVLKPFDPPDLIANVARALGAVRLGREKEALALALAQRESSLRTLVETVPGFLLVLDERGKVLQANSAVVDAVGADREDVEGSSWVDAFVPAADRPVVRQALSRALSDPRGYSAEHRILGATSDEDEREIRWAQWTWTSVAVDGERRIYASGLDVTDVRELQRRARLAEKLAAVGTLSAGLAHEIRNPLNAAGLQLQLLDRRLSKLPEPERFAGIVDTVESEIGRLSRLVDDFLRFARPAHLRVGTVDVADLLSRVVELVALPAKERGVNLTCGELHGSLEIEGDTEKLSQVLHNLVRNALDAASEGGHVEVSARGTSTEVEISVKDDGTGIPAENLGRIFEPFFSTKEDGTGLGMAICHSLVSLHDGDIQVASRPGSTTFKVILPARPPT